MCGIAGIVHLDGGRVHTAQLLAMCTALAHRGPDDEGLYVAPGVGLGMRRLSIIDLEAGQQPIHNEDQTITVVLNGEIYNYQTLRGPLEASGHRFATAGDAESIVHLYEEHGAACVQALRGMFAFALWDQPRRTLLLARDRLGIKPLYYTEVGRTVAFASELKALLELPEIQARIDWQAFGTLLTTMHTPADRSIVAGVRKLEPGHMLQVGVGHGIRVQRYWDLSFEPDYRRSEADTADQLLHLMAESVRLHSQSDVPLGALLSGGVDSSTVVALMSRSASQPVKTFSIGCRDQDFDESPDAKLVAQALGTDHYQDIVGPDIVASLEDLAFYLDEPFGDSSAIPTYMVSKLAARHVKVVLSGDGGDELFAGYERYQLEGRQRRHGKLTRWTFGQAAALMPEGLRGRERLRRLSLSDDRRYLHGLTLFEPHEQRALLRREVFDELARHDPWAREARQLARGGHWLTRLQQVDLASYLPLDILTKVDRMSMAHSIEARVPFLDHVLVEFAATIPPELLLNAGRTKLILKRAVRGLLPDSVLTRRKRGFAVPLGRWFRGPLRDFVHDLLLSERSRRRDVFDAQAVERLLADERRGRALGLPLWTLVSFELWCRTFLDRPGPVSRSSVPDTARHWMGAQATGAYRAGNRRYAQ